MAGKIWAAKQSVVRPPALDDAERQAIVDGCDELVRDFLRPTSLPEIRPTRWNYLVDIRGEWRGGRYRFIQRYRSGMADNLGEESDAPFVRLDRTGPYVLDIYWMRHTGKWWRLHSGKTLAEALHILRTNGILHPL